MTSLLPKRYKKMFPFRLGTTSYVYPDHIIPNVAKLAPFLDEIELVLFESEGKDSLPDESELKMLREFSLHHGIHYNVHLPLDLFLGDPNEEVRSKSVSVAICMIQKTLSLDPSVYTLHFDLRDGAGVEQTDIEAWRIRSTLSAQKILGCGIEPNRVSVETLGYPFEWIVDIVSRFGFSICLDVGHLLLGGEDLKAYLEKYLLETSIVHLHGFQDGIDHLGIDRLPESALELIFSYLRNYNGIVSLEVFSIDDLRSSLDVLEEQWARR
jgi:sugar phosphate isomerase/epimerase